MAVGSLKYTLKKGFPVVMSMSTWVDAKVLAVTASETFAPTTGANHMVIVADNNFYLQLNSTAAVIPSADNTTGGNAIFIGAGIPRAFELGNIPAGGFSVISDVATVITMEFFK